MSYTCPVCGYPCLTERPRLPRSGGASFEICPSCGYQFGHTDDLLEIDYATWGKEWIDAGMPWRSVNPPPQDWDPEKQLKRLHTGSSERGERGQAMVELAGVLLVVALIVAAVFASAALVALVLGLALDAGHEPRRLLWAAIAGGVLLIAAFANPAGMGMGDVKLLAVMGLFLGRPVVIALFAALLATLAVAVALAVRGGVAKARKTALPFGPCLAVGGLLAAVVGDPLLHAYLSSQ